MHDLHKALSGDRRYLVIDVDGNADLLTIVGWTEKQGAIVAMDLRKALEHYHELVAKGDIHHQWCHAEICKIAGVSTTMGDNWNRAGYLRASIAPARGHGADRRYDYLDGFVAGVLGSLARQGVRKPHLQQTVADLIYSLVPSAVLAN